jgi:uncharacterized membrane protein
VTIAVSRGVAFLAWLLAWQHHSPAHWIDVIALTGVAVGLLVLRRHPGPEPEPRPGRLPDFIIPPEAWGLLAVAVSAWLGRAISLPWHETPELNWQRWAVAPAVLGCATLLRHSGRMSTHALAAVFLVGAAMLAAWATQMLVWRHGWLAVGVLWTLLGFAYVSTGLWQRLAVLRQAGFALLAMALLKLFISDVWNFEAFIRVAAFLALGVALVLLGFFYNRFAGVLRKLLEQEEP